MGGERGMGWVPKAKVVVKVPEVRASEAQASEAQVREEVSEGSVRAGLGLVAGSGL